MRASIVVSGLVVLSSACAGWPADDHEQGIERRSTAPDPAPTAPAPANPDEVATIRLNFTTVPTGVLCVSVAVTSGGSTKTKSVDVTAGSKPAGGNSDGSFDLGRFAPGTATVSAKGYEVACASVTTSVVPAWFSKSQTINVVAGPPIAVTVNLQKVQSPDVTVNFELTPARLFGTAIAMVGVLEDGSAKLWGFDASDTNSIANRILVPTTISGLSNVALVAGGMRHNCAALKDGTVRCWGLGIAGSLGDGDSSIHTKVAPGTVVSGVSNVVALASHGDTPSQNTAHTCAVEKGGALKCWGANDTGQLGVASPANATSPVVVPLNAITMGGIGAIQVCAGAGFTCALDERGNVSCWGRNDVGQLGRGTTSAVPAGDIERIAGAGVVTQLACGGAAACVIRADGSLTCWGRIVGNPTVIPTQLEASGVQQVVLGSLPVSADNFACLRRTNGQVACWGSNGSGQLGDGTGVDRTTRDVVTIAGATELAAGIDHACAIVDGRTLCWGEGSFIGDGTNLTRAVPTPVKW